MYETTVRLTVAMIVIFGHIFTIAVGFILLVLDGPMKGTDGVQLILISSPVLAATGIAALKNVLNTGTSRRTGKKLNAAFSVTVISLPVLLVLAILATFLVAYFAIGDLGPDGVKITLGGIETLFGAYLGAISDTLFKEPEKAP